MCVCRMLPCGAAGGAVAVSCLVSGHEGAERRDEAALGAERRDEAALGAERRDKAALGAERRDEAAMREQREGTRLP